MTPPGNSPEGVKAGLSFMLGLRQAERALTLLPFAAFLEKLDAFKTLQDGTLAAYGVFCKRFRKVLHTTLTVAGEVL